MQFLTWIIVVKVLQNWRKAFEGVRGPSVRRLVHDVAQDFFHPRRRLLFETVNVDGPENKGLIKLNKLKSCISLEKDIILF
jgi:hypothetical protein